MKLEIQINRFTVTVWLLLIGAIADTFIIARASEYWFSLLNDVQRVEMPVISPRTPKVLSAPLKWGIGEEIKAMVLSENAVVREVSMYTSTPEQTDGSPCLASDGDDICVLWKSGQNLCATNSAPLGSVFRIEKLGECIVYDRMNARFKYRIDWYAGYDDDCLDGVDFASEFHGADHCPNYRRAKEFGVQKLLVDRL